MAPDGYGKSYYNNGDTKYDGNWRQSKFDGYSIEYNKNKTIEHSGLFRNGVITKT